MEEWSFEIRGNIPSKKNSRQLFVRNGRVMNVPSKRYKEWHKNASIELIDRHAKFKGVLEIKMAFWLENNRRADLDNKCQSILDLLQDCEIIEDDRWQIVRRLVIEGVGIDRENPRVEVTVKQIE